MLASGVLGEAASSLPNRTLMLSADNIEISKINTYINRITTLLCSVIITQALRFVNEPIADYTLYRSGFAKFEA